MQNPEISSFTSLPLAPPRVYKIRAAVSGPIVCLSCADFDRALPDAPEQTRLAVHDFFYNATGARIVEIIPVHASIFEREPELRAWADQQWKRLSSGDDYVDNERIAEVGNEGDELEYQQALERGCCGFSDTIVTHRKSGRKFRVGYNYGH